MIERLYVPAAIIVSSLIIAGAVILGPLSDAKPKTIPAVVSEYALSLARIHESAELGTDITTFTALTVDAGARHWAARKLLPSGTSGQCGHGLDVTRKSIGIWKDIAKDGIVLQLEQRLLDVGVPVQHDQFRKIATSHVARFQIKLTARAHGNYDVIRDMDESENELKRSFISDVLSAADRAVVAELQNCAALNPSTSN